MLVKWRWEAVFETPDHRLWFVKSPPDFNSAKEAKQSLVNCVNDGSVCSLGVPEGSKLLGADAILELMPIK